MALTEIPPREKRAGGPPFFLLLGQTLIRSELPESHLKGPPEAEWGGLSH